ACVDVLGAPRLDGAALVVIAGLPRRERFESTGDPVPLDPGAEPVRVTPLLECLGGLFACMPVAHSPGLRTVARGVQRGLLHGLHDASQTVYVYTFQPKYRRTRPTVA